MTTQHRNSTQHPWAGALAGLLAGTAGVAAGQAAAATLDGVTAPVLAVGGRAIDLTPRPVKEWAIETFGAADKLVLVGGILVTVAALLAVIGTVAVRRAALGVGLLLVLNLVAGAAAVTDRAATAGPAARLAAPVVGLVVSVAALLVLLRPLRRRVLPGRVEGDDLPTTFDRRGFLRAAAAVGALAAAGGAASRLVGGSSAAVSRAASGVPRPDRMAPPVPPGASFGIDGLPPFVSSNGDFYRVDTALSFPDVPIDTWRLRIHGLVDTPIDLSFRDLLSRRMVERRITLMCVSNPVGGDLIDNASWIGVRLADLLAEAGVQPGADAVKSTSADGFTVGTPLSALTDGRDALVAVAMNGEPLPIEHGFPARMVVPGLYGYVSATKWVVDLEVTRFDDFQAYWTERGYAAQAPIKTSSRIDVPASFADLEAGKVTVAGLAWAQDRGIERVEVRADEGPGQQATLADEDNADTWRQWRWTWDAAPGTHRLEVRATDHTGNTQTSRREPIAPDGSTGWHSVTVTVS